MPIINFVCEINQIFLNEQTPRIGGEYTRDVHFSNKSCLRVIIWENLKWHLLFVQHQKTALIPENWIGLSILFPLAIDIKKYMFLSLHICRIWTTKNLFIVKWYSLKCWKNYVEKRLPHLYGINGFNRALGADKIIATKYCYVVVALFYFRSTALMYYIMMG